MELDLPCLSYYSVDLAVWAPFGEAASQAAFPRLKTRCSGLWLHSKDAGVFTVEVPPEGDSARLTITLRSRQRLASCQVVKGVLHCTALCPKHTGSGCWVLVLRIQAAGKEHAIAARFELEHAGQECAALLQALLAGTATRRLPKQPCALVATEGQQMQHGQAMEAAGSKPVDLKEQIKAYLADPDFMAYVDQVEQAWLEVEQALEGEA